MYRAMSGLQMLAAALIDERTFACMPRSVSPGRGTRSKPRSKYMPRQGKQECARRVRQMEASRG